MDEQNILTTSEIAVLPILGYPIDTRWVDWAQAMLAEGKDTPTLRILAGELPPFDSLEIRPMLDQTLKELGIELPNSCHEAAVQLATIRVQQMVDGKITQAAALPELASLHADANYEQHLADFYRLDDALRSIEYGEYHYYGWPDVESHELPDFIHRYCLDWLQRYGHS